jgi:hypothetical protein
MAYPAPAYWNESSGGLPNSGRLSGTAGDLVGILDVALVASGWAIEYTASNARVYRAASGNRFRACFDENTAISGDARLVTYRGAENASAAGSANWTDPFPTPTQAANNVSTILKSTAASTAARAFDLWIWATGFILATNPSNASNTWEVCAFGDADPSYTGDSYNTVCMNRTNSTATSIASGMMGAGITGSTCVNNIHWARSYDGTTKSTYGGIAYPSSTIGNITNCAPARGGATGGIDAERMPLLCSGNNANGVMTSAGLIRRGIFPYLWLPMHGGPGTVNARDTGSIGSPAAAFSMLVCSASNWMMAQTDGWTPPSG